MDIRPILTEGQVLGFMSTPTRRSQPNHERSMHGYATGRSAQISKKVLIRAGEDANGEEVRATDSELGTNRQQAFCIQQCATSVLDLG
jgi:hypothetical protein